MHRRVKLGSALLILRPMVQPATVSGTGDTSRAAAAYSAPSPNLSIDVPPIGMPTVHGTCTLPPGSKFFLWTTRTHKYATNVDINYVSGGAFYGSR